MAKAGVDLHNYLSFNIYKFIASDIYLSKNKDF